MNRDADFAERCRNNGLNITEATARTDGNKCRFMAKVGEYHACYELDMPTLTDGTLGLAAAFVKQAFMTKHLRG